MREDKWGILERFRIRPASAERVPPGLIERYIGARMAALGDGYVLGPFELTDADGTTWWTVLWEFPTRDAAAGLIALLDDPEWNRHVETCVSQGHKYLPEDGLPGF